MTSDLRPDPVVDPAWTPDELATVRADLMGHLATLQAELALADSDMIVVAAASAGGTGNDDGDLAGYRAELAQEGVLAANTFAILEQVQHVVARLDDGLYGQCEGCDGTVGRARLEAFPRATRCRDCASQAA